MTSVTRGKDENGNGIYKISAGLVHMVLLSIVGAIVTVGGYMVVWAVNDNGWKATMAERLTSQNDRIQSLEAAVKPGALPLAHERLQQHERRLDALERRIK